MKKPQPRHPAHRSRQNPDLYEAYLWLADHLGLQAPPKKLGDR